jgi:hypothetical protein
MNIIHQPLISPLTRRFIKMSVPTFIGVAIITKLSTNLKNECSNPISDDFETESTNWIQACSDDFAVANVKIADWSR